ncbi:DUF975 family protein [Paludicola sp. MB14-C6]|uniref:DUF975 family protein n=1 Tax=Paludihabitans sp. MB14-C6 TaxID=3070656 RepID=UPI0027DD0D07|nr:DUF975 family protein [Paludicola sp. MB14-C6]WMJ22811.1 DUF975 family protein [Paludicola sp. MB14-C6]
MTTELKNEAKQCYKQNTKKLLTITAIYVAINWALDFAAMLISDPTRTIIQLCIPIITSIFDLGYFYILFQIKRGEPFRYWNIVLFFSNLKYLRKAFCISLLINLLILFPACNRMLFELIKHSRLVYGFSFVSLVILIGLIYLFFHLFLSEYILVNEPTMPLMHILKYSFIYMKGNIFKLITLNLSFILLGIAFFIPYCIQYYADNTILIYSMNIILMIMEVLFFPYYYLTLISFVESICPMLKGNTNPVNQSIVSEYMTYENDDHLTKMYDKALHVANPQTIEIDETLEENKEYEEDIYDELYEEYGEEFFEDDYLQYKAEIQESEAERSEREKFEANEPLSKNEFTYQFSTKSIDDLPICKALYKTELYHFLILNERIQAIIKNAYARSVKDYQSYENDQETGSAADDDTINNTYFRVVSTVTKPSNSYQIQLIFYISE